MVIRFCNLGKIRETEIDLRPLSDVSSDSPERFAKSFYSPDSPERFAKSFYSLWQPGPPRKAL